MLKNYVLNLLQECNITIAEFKNEMERINKIIEQDNKYIQLSLQLDAIKGAEKIFAKGYIEVSGIIYKRLDIDYSDNLRFYIDENLNIYKVEIETKDDSSLLGEIVEKYYGYKKITDKNMIDELFALSKLAQTRYQNLKSYITGELGRVEKELYNTPYIELEPVEEKFRVLYSHATDEQMQEIYADIDPEDNYWKGENISYQEYLSILDQIIKL